jgi:hypothetical protein
MDRFLSPVGRPASVMSCHSGSEVKMPVDIPVVTSLKVPKCEIFDPFFFTSINPIWVGDLRTGEKFFFFEDHGRYSPFFFLRRLSLR